MTGPAMTLAVFMLTAFAAGVGTAMAIRAMLKLQATVSDILAASSAPAAMRIIDEPLPQEPLPEPAADEAPGVTQERVEPPKLVAPPQSPEAAPCRPKGLPAPRLGRADQLTAISGITQAEERMLHHLGIYHLSQIAVWGELELRWIDQHVGLVPGTAAQWSEAARSLTATDKVETLVVFAPVAEVNPEAESGPAAVSA